MDNVDIFVLLKFENEWYPRGIQISLHIRSPGFQARGGYSRVNFGHLKSEVFHLGGGAGGYSGVNFGHLKSAVFHFGGGYSGVNFGHLKSEVFSFFGGWGGVGVFQSKLWSSQI